MQSNECERVITILRVWGLSVAALDPSEHIANVLMGSDLYCTDENGTFAAL